MAKKQSKKFSWREVADIRSAKNGIDMGYLLDWSDARHLCKVLDDSSQVDFVKHITERLGERCSDRLSSEILIETLLVFLTFSAKESHLVPFIEALINQVEFEAASRVFVEVSLSTEFEDEDRQIEARSTAVALICELGFCVQQIEDESPGHLERGKALLDHITTYLLSVGNTSIQSVRLSLMRYFCHSEYGMSGKTGFTKIMSRFGHTMFDTLFQHLFNKKSEGIALQFLLDNLPTALEATGDSQIILHETFKQYMLKYPERFSLFMHEMAERVLSLNPPDGGQFCAAAESYYKHLIALYKVTSDLDHRNLGREVLSEILRLEKYPGANPFSSELATSPQIRRMFRDMVVSQRRETNNKERIVIISQFRVSKRGRKPTLNKKLDAGFLEQVMLLGKVMAQKSA
jgi:hypothetical protein